MNVIKMYFDSSKSESKKAFGEWLDVGGTFVRNMVEGTPIPESKKLAVYKRIYAALPSRGRVFIIKDVTKMCKRYTELARECEEIKRME